MKPDYDRAAVKAMETLIKYNISSGPVDPLPIFKHIPGVLVLSFTEMSRKIGMDRSHLLTAFDTEQHDAVTSVRVEDGQLLYIVTYNQRLPLYLVQRALARELGHIVLGHDGSKPEDVRMAEAFCFAHHLLCPRPIIRAVKGSGMPFTIEVLGAMTGCYERCLQGMKKEPGAHVPAELNRKIHYQFADYINNFLDYESYLFKSDESALADFGTYMDNYEE